MSNRDIRAAFCIRSDYLKARGGDTVQALETKKYLESCAGITVTIVGSPSELTASDFDICHLFNIQKIEDTKAYLAKCLAAKLKVALSPVLWDYAAVDTYNFMVKRLSAFEISPRRIAWVTKGLKLIAPVVGMPTIFTTMYREYLRQALSTADLLLPNSVEEADMLARLSGLDLGELLTKTRPVVNAVTLSEPKPVTDADFGGVNHLPSGYILQVGRIEPGRTSMPPSRR